MLVLISAPSNLGLRPPQPGAVPGTAKAPEALREAGLHGRFAELGAADGGVVLPGRYLDDAQAGVPRSRNQEAVVNHARLAGRIGGHTDFRHPGNSAECFSLAGELHLDVDILDPAVMPAVDSPDPGGLDPAELTDLLTALAPRATGAQVTGFDPDLDPDGRYAALLTGILATSLARLGQGRD